MNEEKKEKHLDSNSQLPEIPPQIQKNSGKEESETNRKKESEKEDNFIRKIESQSWFRKFGIYIMAALFVISLILTIVVVQKTNDREHVASLNTDLTKQVDQLNNKIKTKDSEIKLT